MPNAWKRCTEFIPHVHSSTTGAAGMPGAMPPRPTTCPTRTAPMGMLDSKARAGPKKEGTCPAPPPVGAAPLHSTSGTAGCAAAGEEEAPNKELRLTAAEEAEVAAGAMLPAGPAGPSSCRAANHSENDGPFCAIHTRRTKKKNVLSPLLSSERPTLCLPYATSPSTRALSRVFHCWHKLLSQRRYSNTVSVTQQNHGKLEVQVFFFRVSRTGPAAGAEGESERALASADHSLITADAPGIMPPRATPHR